MVGVFEVADGVDKLALGDGGVPTFCPVAVRRSASAPSRQGREGRELAYVVWSRQSWRPRPQDLAAVHRREGSVASPTRP